MRLDVEFLGRAVEHLLSQGFSPTGYLLVLSDEVAKSARRWTTWELLRHENAASIATPRYRQPTLDVCRLPFNR